MPPRLSIDRRQHHADVCRHVQQHPPERAARRDINAVAKPAKRWCIPGITARCCRHALHWQLSDSWTAYAQLAKGFLAPNLNTFYTSAPQDNTVKPQPTINKQLGTTWSDGRLTLSADGYYIHFNNKIESRTVGAITTFYNAGGAVYKGLEGEATYTFAEGFAAHKSVKIGVQVNNVFDNKSVYYLSGYTAQDNTPLYFTIPARSYELTFSAKL